MRWSRAFIPTLREVPAEAEVQSHRLLLRAGYVRQVAAGLYAYLYLAQKSFLKIAKIVREEMNRIGGQEFYLPALNPAELWKETGRWDSVDVMFKFKDRNQHEIDRKSTRLNSSHGYISYAVFCLKKKKK